MSVVKALISVPRIVKIPSALTHAAAMLATPPEDRAASVSNYNGYFITW